MGGGEALGADNDAGVATEDQNEVQKMFEVRPGLAVEASIFDELLSARKLELLNDPVGKPSSGKKKKRTVVVQLMSACISL